MDRRPLPKIRFCHITINIKAGTRATAPARGPLHYHGVSGPLHTTHYILHTIYYTLHTTHYTLHTTHYTLHITHYILPSRQTDKQTNRQTDRQRIQIQRPLLSPVDCRGERQTDRQRIQLQRPLLSPVDRRGEWANYMIS